jgi:hypothetical protein
MRRVAPALVSVLLGVGAYFLYPTVALAGPVICQQYDSHGICIVKAGSDGHGAGPSAQPAAAEPGSGDGRDCPRFG